MGNTPHVAIVGAGFGGLGVAEQLDHVPVEVTLIDQHNYHTFQPLLYQVASSLLNAEDVGAPVRSLFRHQENVTFRMATVTSSTIKSNWRMAAGAPTTNVGRQIARRILGEQTQPFRYWDKGFMATIGRGSAVVEFPNK